MKQSRIMYNDVGVGCKTDAHIICNTSNYQLHESHARYLLVTVAEAVCFVKVSVVNPRQVLDGLGWLSSEPMPMTGNVVLLAVYLESS